MIKNEFQVRKLVKITPLGAFFFGGEKTFNNPQGEVSYFARSNQWPQQTGILGMLRYLMATVKENFDQSLIGENSFNASLSDQNFGIIKELSPVFLLQNNGTYWIEAGRDYQKQKDGQIEQILFAKEENQLKAEWGIYGTSIQSKPMFFLNRYDYKSSLGGVLVNADFIIDNSVSKEFLLYEKVFTELEKVGNKKNYTGGSDQEAFFKQVSYIMDKKYSFALEVLFEYDQTWADKKDILFRPRIASLGANQSKFQVEFTDLPTPKIPQLSGRGKRLVLISDALVSENSLNCCDFALSETVDFRNIITTSKINSDDWAKVDRKDKGTPYKSEDKYNLLKRGSVLYFSEEQEAEKVEIFKKPDFQKIGYNNYYITK